MDVTAFSGPTPGAAAPGNLYADLQSRTLWLGVDPAVDPNQSVLISDILSLDANIDGCLAEAKAYTDQQIVTRAPTSHTHTSSQITDFSSAVTTVVAGIPGFAWVRGMVMQYSGSLADIGVGSLAGWSLCDGSNGTPDLRDRFVIGAGNKPVGEKNPLASVTTSDDGAHTPVINGVAISIAQMPAHAHGNTGINSSDHIHAININSGTESAPHTHSTGIRSGQTGSAGGSAGSSSDGGIYQTGGESATHFHNVAGNTGNNTSDHTHTIPTQGGGATHTHIAAAVAAHHHTLSSNQVRDVSPYYALAFIMKL